MTTHTQATKTATPRRAAHFATTTPGSSSHKPTEVNAQAAKGPASAHRIGAIDGLRALAIAGVVLYHLRPSVLAVSRHAQRDGSA